MNLKISDDNILLADSEFLQAKKTTPETLFDVLVNGRWLIEQAIEDMYQELARDPELTVRHGSVWVMRLAKDDTKVITPLGLILDSVSQEDRGVFTRWLDIRRQWWPYWEAVYQAGFRAEARTSSHGRQTKGFCLLVYLKNSR